MASIVTNAPSFALENGLFARVVRAFANWKLYRRTLEELESLSARELADLGLSGVAIRQVARDSVYRK